MVNVYIYSNLKHKAAIQKKGPFSSIITLISLQFLSFSFCGCAFSFYLIVSLSPIFCMRTLDWN